MVEAGVLKEAEQAFEALGLDGSQPLPNSLNTVGYKEIYTYLQGLWSWDRTVEMIQQNSRHYAKRQMTWWNRDKQINWIDLT
jgi:tRNA dimethylallyltransferase